MQSLVSLLKPRTWAIIAGVFSGVTFGIYWIPLRHMDQAGIHGMWAVAVFNTVALVLVIPWIIRHRRRLFPGRLRMHVNALLAGLSYVVYIGAFLYTEVVRVLVLFYMMPLWGFLFAWLFAGQAITPIRWLGMALGLAGLAVICGVENGIPLPANLGDWMALVSGIAWAGIALSILKDQPSPVNYTITFLFWAAVCALLVAAPATQQGLLPAPDWSALGAILAWLIPLAILVILPAAFCTLYAPSQLNPGVVGLLFMTEISVGAGSAALFADEPFGAREITGIILITLAGISEPVRDLFAGRRRSDP